MFIDRKIKSLKNRSGQSTVEYIVLATAVIAAVIFFVAPGRDGKSVLLNQMVNTMNTATDQVTQRSEVLGRSQVDELSYVAPKTKDDFTAPLTQWGNTLINATEAAPCNNPAGCD